MSGVVLRCPDCGTRYATPADRIGPNGRSVRCARCGCVWHVPASDADALALMDNEAETLDLSDMTSGPIPEQEQGPIPSESPPRKAVRGADALMRDRAELAKLRQKRRSIRMIWTGTALLILSALVSAMLFRHAVVEKLPETAALYGALGFEVSPNGLVLDEPQARTLLIEGVPVIRIDGSVRNLTDRARPVPLIALELYGAGGETLLDWYVETKPARIAADGRQVYTSEIADPPEGVVGLRFTFAEDAS